MNNCRGINFGIFGAILGPFVGAGLILFVSYIFPPESISWWISVIIICPFFILATSSKMADGSLLLIIMLWGAIIYFSLLGFIVSYFLKKRTNSQSISINIQKHIRTMKVFCNRATVRPSEPNSFIKNFLKQKPIQAGLLYSIIGIAVGIFIVVIAVGDGYAFFPFYSGVSAFLTFSILWWIIVERINSTSIFRGIISGCLSGIFSHYVCWYLFFIKENIKHIFFTTDISLTLSPSLDFIESIYATFVLTKWSLLFFGWFTILTGGIIGGFFIIYSNNTIIDK